MKYHLTIGWLYPELMSTYGDRGNITVLQKRCEWRGINASVINITQETKSDDLKKIDLLFGGGAQDREQEIVMRDLQKKKETINSLIEHDTPALFVCGAPQLMGKYYEPLDGKRIEGLGVFDMVSKHPGSNIHRLIGNIAAEVYWENLNAHPVIASEAKQSQEDGVAASQAPRNDVIVGFENHGGRTHLGKNVKPFAKVLKGYGNNGEDGTEGVVYKNAIGCYFHGPLLPKNPGIADWLIRKALEVKYKEKMQLEPLDDTLEFQAQKAIAMRLGIRV